MHSSAISRTGGLPLRGILKSQHDSRAFGYVMNREDRFIASCPSWEDFWLRTTRLSKAEMGRAFERLVQLYLQTEPEYRTKLRHVWTLREVPPKVRKLLELPGPDEGIDLIARTSHGEYWAIQSKFRSQRASR